MRYDPERINELLAAQGRKTNWLATVTGYDRAYVSVMLNGHRPMPMEFIQSAARHLGVPVTWLAVNEPVEEAVAA